MRSRAFREQSHKNLGDGSGGPGVHTDWRTQTQIDLLRNAAFVICVPDHPHVIRAMAKKWEYMDLENIGVWGHSAGGEYLRSFPWIPWSILQHHT